MNILAFDTCLDKTYVTLVVNTQFQNKVILSNDNNYHSAFLISTIIELLKNANLEPKDLDYIATDIGPGSFTGIRACVTVARMLAQQLNIKLIGISSLEILSKILGADDVVALDARKNKAYIYDKKILGAIELEKVDEIIKNKRLVTDNSLIDRFKQYTNDIVSYQQQEYPIGEILAQAAIEKINKDETVEWRNLKPLYIQPPPVFGK